MHRVYKFSPAKFAELLASEETTTDFIKKKDLFSYFCRYLKELKVAFILLEDEYISADYLKDYTTYYADCYKVYKKTCKRLHFFTSDPRMGKTHVVDAFLLKENATRLRKAYLGYIVARPIPDHVFGFSILQTYSLQPKYRRSFWATRPYKVHLLGLEFVLESLAFQEQDTSLSACATMSIWTVLQKAAENYYIKLKTPGEITLEAGIISNNGNRLLPNTEGLMIPEMAAVITKSGLQPETRVVNVDSNKLHSNYIRRLIRAYAGLEMPLILTIELSEDEGHAVAIVGYREPRPAKPERSDSVSWLADNIDVIYVHDDQIGPFAYARILEGKRLASDWEKKVSDDSIKTVISSVIMPVYPEVKVSFDDLEGFVLGLDEMLNQTVGKYFLFDICWDLQLIPSEVYKKRVAGKNGLSPAHKSLLSENLPKYIWTCKCFMGDFLMFEIIFDATSLIGGMLALKILFEWSFIKDLVFEALTNEKKDAYAFFSMAGGPAFADFLLDATLED